MQEAGVYRRGLLNGENPKTSVFECLEQNRDLTGIRHLFIKANSKYLDEPLPDLENSGPCGPNLLVFAIDNDRVDAVRELLLCGANPHYLTQVGVDTFVSPLQYALDQREQPHADRNIVELLLIHGAKLQASESDDPNEEQQLRLQAHQAAQQDYPDLLAPNHPLFCLCLAALKALNHPKANADLGQNLFRRMLEALPQRDLSIYEWVIAEFSRTEKAGFSRTLQPISLKNQSFQLDFLIAIFENGVLLNPANYPDFLTNVKQREKFRADLCARLHALQHPTPVVITRRARLLSVSPLPHQVDSSIEPVQRVSGLHSPRFFSGNQNQYTPLMLAIIKGDAIQIDHELKRVKDPNEICYPRGPTVLHFAIKHSMTAVVRALLLQGASTQLYYVDPDSSAVVGFFESALLLDERNPARKNIIELLSLFRRLAEPNPQFTLKKEKEHHLDNYKDFKAALNQIAEDDLPLSLCYTLATMIFAKPPHKRDPDAKIFLERLLDYLHTAEHRHWVVDDFINTFKTLKKTVQMEFLITLSRLFVRGELSREIKLTRAILCDEKTSASAFPQKHKDFVEYLQFYSDQNCSVAIEDRYTQQQAGDFLLASLDL